MSSRSLSHLEALLMKGTGLKMDRVRSLLEAKTLHKHDHVLKDLLSSKKAHSNPEEVMEDLCFHMQMEFMKKIPFNEISVDLAGDIPINYFKSRGVLPFKEEQDELFILHSNPLNHSSIEDLKVVFVDKSIRPILTTYDQLQEAINYVYEKNQTHLKGLEEIEEEDYDLDERVVDLLDAGEDEAPVIKLVNTLLFRAVKEKASDIHIEPYEKNMVVRFRVDGVLFDIFKPPKRLQNAIVSRIKVMAHLNIAEKRLPQDGRIPLKLAGRDIDVRLSVIPTSFGERLVLRLQDRSHVILSLDQLGFSKSSLKEIYHLLTKTYGVFLVTGPTGSGKSTTLYASLSHMNTIDKNILTIEDPVEQRIQGIGQIQVNSKIGLTFSSGLRSILRQDPNVIMVGEIRDLETMEIAIQASLTGHLVLSTIHTNDSSSAFPRLIDMGCEPFLIATSLLGVVSQRLVRLLCAHCKEPYTPTGTELESLEITSEDLEGAEIHHAVGCSECNQKGYAGRTVIQEFLVVNEEIRTLIMQRKDGGSIRKQALQDGLVTFRRHGVQKILSGLTTIEEVLTNTQMDV